MSLFDKHFVIYFNFCNCADSLILIFPLPIQAASYEKEKQALNREVLTLSQKLLDTRFEINKLEEKNVSILFAAQ